MARPRNLQFKRRSRLRLDTWLLRHLQVAISSLGRLLHAPLATLMTSAVIGIALALPIGLHVLLNNLEALSGNWESGASISLFLKQEISDQQARTLQQRLARHSRIAEIRFVSKAQALAEFRRLSGFDEALDTLGGNPLPALLIIQPNIDQATAERAQRLLQELKKLPEADIVQLDMQWVRRLQAITEIAQRGVLVLAGLLGMAVLLIIGNTIRLEIQNRHGEIEISKLIGATNAFIRRPFLYTGLWYGLFGGIIAWLLVASSIGLLSSPVAELALLYETAFSLSSINSLMVLNIFSGSALLGLLGSWVAVGRHLSAIEPT
ncbi:permease-like cell division protein FtsX [Candidatus Endoriftia persephone]|jgi:cell division transport system permease protein|uniref:Cell division protein FtsX n=3 Tax=Gammaproteobacteria TaxID=1236 RepID=G2FB03_9GAMM|nr:permease-like cell division protein FtsX [Candidatus Endoriftia persephone]EGV52814.1 cell division protein ftsX [endosymbiont of Riftia pachyptila (vent Ph05)]EGW55941.1 cell division protein FtsX [endosymbiont of Tevnia jerichonana (vent Tica)]USF88075.1 permease-like cell division protein FtsX [Candidatus Endoriftia persephone]